MATLIENTNLLTLSIDTEFLTRYIPENKIVDGLVKRRTLTHPIAIKSAHPTSGKIDAGLFLEAFKKILEEHEISEEDHLDKLFYFSFYIEEETTRLRQLEAKAAVMKARTENLQALLRMPFKILKRPGEPILVDIIDDDGNFHHEVELPYKIANRYSEEELRRISVNKPIYLCGYAQTALEFSPDVKITVHGLNGEEVTIESSISYQIMKNIASTLLEDQQIHETDFMKRLAAATSENIKKTLTQPTKYPEFEYRTNLMITQFTDMIFRYLEDNHLLSTQKSKTLSHKQSNFLFDYLALFQALQKPVSFMKKFEELKQRKNFYRTVINAYRTAYSNPVTYIRDTYNDNML